jgi:hypothetical protein
MPRRTKASLQALTAPLLALLLAPCGADVDLTGLWTGSPSGSPKEILLAQRDPDAAADSASFELVCRTTDYMTSSPCGWTSARCTVAGDAVTCTLPVGSGTANAAGDQIMFSGGPDNKFTGGLSGIWASASDKGVDAYLMLHNATTNAVVVWWDTGVTVFAKCTSEFDVKPRVRGASSTASVGCNSRSRQFRTAVPSVGWASPPP